MSLLDSIVTDCVKLIRTVTADGDGGTAQTFVQGEKFPACIGFLSTAGQISGDAGREQTTVTILTPRRVVLKYHDIVKRLSDGKVFRITGDADENKTPPVASLDLRAVSAEEWRMQT